MSLVYLSFQGSFLSCLYRNTSCASGKKERKKASNKHPSFHPPQSPETKRRAILEESIFNIILFGLFLFREDFENVHSQLYLGKTLAHSCYLSVLFLI